VFPVRYELNFYMLTIRSSVFKGLKPETVISIRKIYYCYQLHVYKCQHTISPHKIFTENIRMYVTRDEWKQHFHFTTSAQVV
jgi:hypothetical protein